MIKIIRNLIISLTVFLIFYFVFKKISANQEMFYITMAINALVSLNIYRQLSKKED